MRAKIRGVRVYAANHLHYSDRGFGPCDRKIHEAITTTIDHSARREFTAVGCAGESERKSSATETVERINS
jgi:hypothetical protein